MRIESARQQNDDHEDDETDFQEISSCRVAAPCSMKTASPLDKAGLQGG